MNHLRKAILGLALPFSSACLAAEATKEAGQLLALGDSNREVASAQSGISAEKSSPFANLPSLYSSVEMRHTVVRSQNDDVVVKNVPNLSLRPTLGVRYLDGRLDSAMTFIFRRNPGDLPAARDVFYNETWVKVLSGKNGYVGPYAYSEFDRENADFRYSKVGVNFTGETAVQGTWSTVKLKAYLEPKVLVIGDHYANTRDFAVTPRNETSRPVLALDSTGSATMARKDPTFLDDFGASVKVSPGNWSQLYTGLSVDVTSRWVPLYVARDSAGGVDTALDGYERRHLTFTRWSVGYRFSNQLSVTNQLGHYDGGLYEYEIDSRFADTNHEINSGRWENRLSLTATLL